MTEYLTKEELKQTQLNMLKYIDELCRKHHIHYFVNYGSLLGAIRHQGFIPWDDDIDISMYRSEYERLIDIIQNENHPHYKIMNYDTSDWYFQNFSVLVDTNTEIEDHVKQVPTKSHVFLDIFPIDRFNDTAVIKKAHLYATLRQICYIKKQYIQYGDSKLKDFCRAIMWYVLRPVNPRVFTQLIDRTIKRYRVEDGVYEGAIGVGKDGMKEVFPKNTFKELIDLPFEDMIVCAPKNYDIFLSQFYGNYMQIPSQEEIDYKSHMIQAKYVERTNNGEI